jgi:hypothetical protein
MSVWLDSAALSGTEGALLSISIDVDAGDLESLLETLARVSFPINPQIYHDAAVVLAHPDGRCETRTATLVEFPAYDGQLDELRQALTKSGFDPARMQILDMLSELHSEAAPPGTRRSHRKVQRAG